MIAGKIELHHFLERHWVSWDLSDLFVGLKNCVVVLEIMPAARVAWPLEMEGHLVVNLTGDIFDSHLALGVV